MKSYIKYTKAEPPYFNLSEFLTFPVLPLTSVVIISYIVLYLVGLIPMLVANMIIAFMANYIYYGFRNATPNGRSHARVVPNSLVILSMLPSFLVILGVELLMDVGIYIVVMYQKAGVFHTLYFFAWLFIVLGIPGLYFLIQYLLYQRLLHFQAHHFKSLSLSAAWDVELQVYVEEIAFLNTKKKLIGSVAENDRRGMGDMDKLQRMSLKERNEYLYSTAFFTTIYIPKDADKLRVSWYSLIEDTYYQDEIDFPFDKLIYLENKYPLNQSKLLRGEHTKPVTLSIQEAGKLSLYNREFIIIEPVALKSVPTDEAKKKCLMGFTMYEWFQNKHKQKGPNVVLERIKHRTSLAEYLCNWQLTGSGLEEHTFEINGVKVHDGLGDKVATNIFMERPLPVRMKFSYDRYDWITIHIDAEKLYELLQATGDKETAITFEINLDVENGDAFLSLKRGETCLPFTAFEKEITPHCLEAAQEKFKEIKDTNAKNELLKRVYELIQQKAYIEAQNLCKEALAQYRDLALVYFYEARLLWYTQGYEAAYAMEDYFVEKTKKEPYALARIYNHYGCLLDEEKRYKESLSYFEKAAATYPTEAIYTANIAEIYYKLKDVKQALHYANECTQKGYTSDMISEILELKN